MRHPLGWQSAKNAMSSGSLTSGGTPAMYKVNVSLRTSIGSLPPRNVRGGYGSSRRERSGPRIGPGPEGALPGEGCGRSGLAGCVVNLHIIFFGTYIRDWLGLLRKSRQRLRGQGIWGERGRFCRGRLLLLESLLRSIQVGCILRRINRGLFGHFAVLVSVRAAISNASVSVGAYSWGGGAVIGSLDDCSVNGALWGCSCGVSWGGGTSPAGCDAGRSVFAPELESAHLFLQKLIGYEGNIIVPVGISETGGCATSAVLESEVSIAISVTCERRPQGKRTGSKNTTTAVVLLKTRTEKHFWFRDNSLAAGLGVTFNIPALAEQNASKYMDML